MMKAAVFICMVLNGALALAMLVLFAAVLYAAAEERYLFKKEKKERETWKR